MDPICVGDVERDTIRAHPSVDGAVLVTLPLTPTPGNLWQARFSQSLLKTSDFGRVELGRDGCSVNVTVRRGEQVDERLRALAALVEQTNADVAEEQRRLDAAEELQRGEQDASVARVRRDVDALGGRPEPAGRTEVPAAPAASARQPDGERRAGVVGRRHGDGAAVDGDDPLGDVES